MSQARPGSVVVGVDGSPHGDAALTWAVAHAELAARPLLVVHAAGALSPGPTVRFRQGFALVVLPYREIGGDLIASDDVQLLRLRQRLRSG